MNEKPAKFSFILKATFIVSIIILLVCIFILSIGQKLPVEIKNREIQSHLYIFIFFALHIAIFLTLTGTLKYCKSKSIKVLNIVGTILVAGIMSKFLISNMFKIGFGTWITLSVLFEHRTDKSIVLEQIFDIGALGYGGKRVVKLTPILNIWNYVEYIDTANLNKVDWKYVNKEGDLKFP